MELTYSFLSCKLATIFSIFQFSLFQEKRVNLHEVHAIFQEFEHQLQEITFINIFIIIFYKILSKLRFIFNPPKSFTGNFCEIAHP